MPLHRNPFSTPCGIENDEEDKEDENEDNDSTNSTYNFHIDALDLIYLTCN